MKIKLKINCSVLSILYASIFYFLFVFPFAVHAQKPVLSVFPVFQDISDTGGETAFEIENTGTGVMEWTASKDAEWFSISPDSGTDNGTITVI